jgi:hypothetical protein
VIRASAAWGRPRDRSTTIALALYLSLFNPTHPCIRVFADNRLYLYVRGRARDLPPWHSRLTCLYSIPRTPVYVLYIIDYVLHLLCIFEVMWIYTPISDAISISVCIYVSAYPGTRVSQKQPIHSRSARPTDRGRIVTRLFLFPRHSQKSVS